jgi:hypothetical protein
MENIRMPWKQSVSIVFVLGLCKFTPDCDSCKLSEKAHSCHKLEGVQLGLRRYDLYLENFKGSMKKIYRRRDY